MRLKHPENLQSIHIYQEKLNYPVVVYACSDWEETQIKYMSENFKNGIFTTYSLCLWCISHQILYQILYPISRKSIIRNPYKFYKFCQLKRKLRKK